MMALGRADRRPLLWPSGAASPPALCRSRLQSSPEPTLVMKGSGQREIWRSRWGKRSERGAAPQGRSLSLFTGSSDFSHWNAINSRAVSGRERRLPASATHPVAALRASGWLGVSQCSSGCSAASRRRSRSCCGASGLAHGGGLQPLQVLAPQRQTGCPRDLGTLQHLPSECIWSGNPSHVTLL